MKYQINCLLIQLLLGVSTAAWAQGHRIVLMKQSTPPMVFPLDLRVQIECVAMKSGVGFDRAQPVGDGRYSVSVNNEDLKEAQAAMEPLLIDEKTWLSASAWPKFFFFKERPQNLSPQIPGAIFKFKIRFEWKGSDGKFHRDYWERNGAALGQLDYERNPPLFLVQLRPRTTSKPTEAPVEISIRKAQ